MRITLQLNRAGDIRLRCLGDTKHKREISGAQAPALVCSREFQEMTTSIGKDVRPGFGKISERNTFTSYAKRFIREVGALIDSADRRQVVFLTGTLPGSTRKALQALSMWSGWVVQTLSQWARDNDSTAKIFGVWEYQKRGALHLHMCIECSTPEAARKLRVRFKDRWILVLRGVMERSGINVFRRAGKVPQSWLPSVTRTDAQTVEKSVSRYLSKYLSKGSISRLKKCCFPPSRWWFCSKLLATVARKKRLEITIPQLPEAIAIDLFEKLGGEIVQTAKAAYPYFSPYDPKFKGLIALLSPVGASLLFDNLATFLKLLPHWTNWRKDEGLPLESGVYVMSFGVWRKTYAAAG